MEAYVSNHADSGRKYNQSNPQKVRSQQVSNLQPQGSQQHHIGDAKRTLQGQKHEHANGQPSIRGATDPAEQQPANEQTSDHC